MIKVCAGVALDNGKVFITKRKSSDTYPGKWEFPGGKIEKGENPDECILREIKEELGVECRALSIMDEIIYQYPDKKVKIIFIEIKFSSMNIDLKVHEEGKWEDISNLYKYDFLEADIEFLSKLKKYQ